MINKQLENLNNKKSEEIKIKEQLKTVYNILIDEKIDMNRKYEVSHLIIDKVIFNRDDGVLELIYKV